MGFLTDNATGEQDVLATFVLQQLAQLRTTVHGLTDEQVRSTPSASELSLAELLTHTGDCARSYAEMVAEPGSDGNYTEAWRSVAPEDVTLESALERFDAQVARVREILAQPLDMTAAIPVPKAPWFPPELTHWETRWVLAHLISELARHAGHADIVRESIDGAIAYDLNDLAEGKEPQDWTTATDW